MTPRRFLTRRDWLSAAGLLALAGCAGRSREEPIWIGHIGPADERCESAINGMRQTLADLSGDEFTVAGRSLGVRHVEARDKTRARAEASRLLGVNRVACLIVGPDLEGVADVCAIARAHDSIAVVLGGTDDRALSRQAVWLGVGPRTRAEMMARYERVKGPVVEEDVIGLPPALNRSERRSLVLWPAPADLPPEGRAWAERYEKRFGKRPDDDAVLGAEAVALIADGLKAVGKDDREKLAPELQGRTDIAGLTGPIWWEDWQTRRPMWVERVVKGKRVAVEPVPR